MRADGAAGRRRRRARRGRAASGGVARYGADYRDIAWFTEKHLEGAGRRDCDHWHDGAGLYTHHMAFSIEFERALQSVDPAVSLAYWDYSVDSEALGANFSRSRVFDDDWFGALPARTRASHSAPRATSSARASRRGRGASRPPTT